MVLVAAGLMLLRPEPGAATLNPAPTPLTDRWLKPGPPAVAEGSVVDAAWWLPRDSHGVRVDEPPAWTMAKTIAEFAIGGLDRAGLPVSGFSAPHAVTAWCIGWTWAMVMWWAWSLSGPRAGWLAGLIALALPGFAALGREAHPAALWVGASAAASAAGIWAIRPMRPSPGLTRQAAGWVLCGLATGFACLTAGALGLAVVAWPLAVAIVLSPGRLSHGLGMAAAALVAALLVLPWVLTMSTVDPAAVARWWTGELAGLTDGAVPMGQWGSVRAISGMSWAALITLPWVAWVVVAWIQPFSTSSGVARGRLLVAWATVVGLGAAFVLLPAAESLRWAGWLAGVAVMLGVTFDRMFGEVEEGRRPRMWRLGSAVHGLALPIASVALLTLGLAEAWLVQRGWLVGRVFTEVGAWRWWVTGSLLIVLSVVALLEAWALSPRRAVLLWVCWVVVAMVGVLPAISGRPAIVFMYPP